MSRLRGVSFGVVGTAWRERQSYAFVPKWVHGTQVNFLLMDSAAKEKRQRESASQLEIATIRCESIGEAVERWRTLVAHTFLEKALCCNSLKQYLFE